MSVFASVVMMTAVSSGDSPLVQRSASPAKAKGFDVLLAGVKGMWERMQFPGNLYRMHHIASELQYPGSRQLSLFDPPLRNDERILDLMHAVNERHGRFAVRSAATLPLEEIYADDAHSFEICDIHGKTWF